MSGTHSVIVVGSGLAALCATIEASDNGANVTVIEKDKRYNQVRLFFYSGGGNSTKASSGISCSETHYQAEKNILDTNEAYNKDLLKSGEGKSLPEIVDVATSHSSSAIDFLDKHGLVLGTVLQCGGHSFPRTHRFVKDAQGKAPPVGWTLVSTLRKEVESRSNCKVLCGCCVKQLLQNEAKDVIGVEYENEESKLITLNANAVILACGGYANDHTENSLLKEFVPQIADLPTTNGSFATGDGVKLARKIGAQLTLMDQVQLHPTGFIDPNDVNNTTKFLAPEALRGVGGILVNTKGLRFINELNTRDVVTKGIQQNCEAITVKDGVKTHYPSAYVILSDSMVELLGRGDVGFYMSKSLLNKVENIKELCEKTHLPEDTITNTIKKYITSVEKKHDEFDKTVFPNTFDIDGPYYYGIVTPSLHYTMGGIKINTKCQVLNTDGNVIVGLYGAGEVTGGLHGANRLAGASLMECVVFGRIAGEEAAKL